MRGWGGGRGGMCVDTGWVNRSFFCFFIFYLSLGWFWGEPFLLNNRDVDEI